MNNFFTPKLVWLCSGLCSLLVHWHQSSLDTSECRATGGAKCSPCRQTGTDVAMLAQSILFWCLLNIWPRGMAYQGFGLLEEDFCLVKDVMGRRSEDTWLRKHLYSSLGWNWCGKHLWCHVVVCSVSSIGLKVLSASEHLLPSGVGALYLKRAAAVLNMEIKRSQNTERIQVWHCLDHLD